MGKTDPAQPALSDQHNLLVDCHFGEISDPGALALRLQAIPGVAGHGLFLGLARAALLVQDGQVRVLRPGQPARPASEFEALPGK